MINHIDVSSVLRRTVSDLYTNLVTRSTGAAVRQDIELQLAESPFESLTVLDFSHVGLLDLSCADEIVAKLLLRHGSDTVVRDDGYFVVRGVNEAHLDAIEAVLERHGLAVIADLDGTARLVGMVDEAEREAWEIVRQLGRAAVDDVAMHLHRGAGEMESLLDRLTKRRLLVRLDSHFVAIGATVS